MILNSQLTKNAKNKNKKTKQASSVVCVSSAAAAAAACSSFAPSPSSARFASLRSQPSRGFAAGASLTDAINLADLKPEVVSFNPLTVKLPASTLVPLLGAEINAQPGRSGSTETQKYNIGEIYIELLDNEVYVKVVASAGRRGFTDTPLGKVYTPWVSAGFRVKARFAVSVENFVVKANETYLDIEGRGDITDAIIRTFAGPIYGMFREGLKKALERISGQDLHVSINKYLTDTGVAFPPTTRLDVRVKPDGLYVILGS